LFFGFSYQVFGIFEKLVQMGAQKQNKQNPLIFMGFCT